MCSHADRADARTAAAMRDGEGLVQVEVADIGPDMAGRSQAHLGVHVGPVHVHLAAVFVHDAADVHDALFKDTVRGGVGYHHRAQRLLVAFGLGAHVGDVDIAVLVAVHHYDLEAGHRCAGRVRAVCRAGDQADVAPRVAAVVMVCADDQHTGILTGGAGVALQRDGGKAGDLRQPLFEAVEQVAVALGLVRRHEGVQGGKFGPQQGQHFGGGVELHRA